MTKPAAKKATGKAAEPAAKGESVATLPPTFLDMLQASEGIAKEISGERQMVKFTEPGQWVVALLVSLREAVNFEGVIYELDAADGSNLVTVGSTDLDRKLSGTHVGHVVGIFYIADEDVGKADPMKRFRVFDYGRTFPSLNGAEPNTPEAVDSDDLPF